VALLAKPPQSATNGGLIFSRQGFERVSMHVVVPQIIQEFVAYENIKRFESQLAASTNGAERRLLTEMLRDERKIWNGAKSARKQSAICL
jgi:hypothetical protein